MPRFRVASLLCGALLIPLACAPDWESVDDVRGAVLNAGAIGRPPAEVERRLAALRLEGGRRLAVGSFQPRYSVVEAQVRDAEGQPRDDYNVNVTVHFDAAGRADSVAVFTSAVSPL